MSDLWVPVIAALGASALTGMVAFGLEWWRSKKADKSARAERRARAYSMLLAHSGVIIHIASGFHIAMEARSGLREGLNVTLGIQKPLDPLELTDRLHAVLQPLYEAWSEVWVVGSKEAIPEANDLIARCGAVMGAATQRGEAGPSLLRVIAGEKWTQKQFDQWQEELRGLAEARRRLGIIARRETGVEVADLFASNESKPPSKTSEEQGNGATHSPETVKAQGTGNKKTGRDGQHPG
jgi:hypothetical protein